MIKWQKKRLSDGADIGPPGELPPDLVGLSETSLAALDWTSEALGYRGFGFVPVVDMASAKTDKLELLQAKRDAVIDGGCAVPGVGTFYTDLKGLVNVNGAVTGAILATMAGQPFEVRFKLMDGSRVTLDGAGVMAVGPLVLLKVAAAHSHAQDLEDEIESAADIAALEAIDIESGWPA